MVTPSMSPFEVHVRADGEGVSLGLVGDFDMSAVEYFQSSVEEVVKTDGDVVVVDLAALTFIDSSGLSALIEMRRRLAVEGRELRVANVSAPAARVFELTALTDVFVNGGAAANPT